jgi:hypothetical protein
MVSDDSSENTRQLKSHSIHLQASQVACENAGVLSQPLTVVSSSMLRRVVHWNLWTFVTGSRNKE